MTMTRDRQCLTFGMTAAILAISVASGQAADDRFSTGSSDPLIEYIDGQIRTGWVDNESEP
ncbi:MAG: hypothetical protein DWQ29_03110, partial [Planctomycetota bacterium]